MERGHKQGSKQPKTGTVQDLLLVILLFAVGFGVRWLYRQGRSLSTPG